MGIIISVVIALVIYLPALISIAYLTLVERKTLGFAQLRRGPAIVGPAGLLQPLADGVKLFSKEIIIPAPSWGAPFLGAPCFGLILSLFLFPFVPWPGAVAASPARGGILFVAAVAGLAIYAVLIGAWSSHSRYALLGGLRAAAQMVSYEIIISLILLTIIIIWSNASPTNFALSQIITGPLLFPLFFISVVHYIAFLAEVNRAPFDLAEGESELVSGFNVEYSAAAFSLYSLAEYGHMVFGAIFWSALYGGGGLGWGVLATLSCGGLLWIRASFPRVRYDLLMAACWGAILPPILAALPFIFWFAIFTP